METGKANTFGLPDFMFQNGLNDLLSTFTFGFLLTSQGCANHGCCATHSTFNSDRAGDTIQLAGTAFHAGRFIYQDGFAPIHLEYCMGTDRHAHVASVTKPRIISKSIYCISIKHAFTPLNE
jgi:hypothetical protein